MTDTGIRETLSNAEWTADMGGDALSAAAGARVVLCVTGGSATALKNGRRAAALLAARAGARLVLCDGCRESWVMPPYVTGPETARDVQRRGDTGLVAQICAAQAYGVPDVLVVAPSRPNVAALVDAVETAGADVVVIPQLERWSSGADQVAGAAAAKDLALVEAAGARVLLADPDGHVSLARQPHSARATISPRAHCVRAPPRGETLSGSSMDLAR